VRWGQSFGLETILICGVRGPLAKTVNRAASSLELATGTLPFIGRSERRTGTDGKQKLRRGWLEKN
jgi:hypothetical protein